MEPRSLMDYAREAAERTRRIETRLTKWLVSEGFETGSQLPVWYDDGVVEVPSRATSLTDIQSVVPIDWDRDYEITVMFRGHVLGVVLRP
jgi:hypothetical protein